MPRLEPFDGSVSVIEGKLKRHSKKALGLLGIILILLITGVWIQNAQTSPAKPVFVRRSGQLTRRYLYEQGVLYSIDCYTYIHNEGKSGNVTVQFTIIRLSDGKCLGKYIKIFHLKEGVMQPLLV